MANRKYRSKYTNESNEFIHVDLLPNVRRPRQFNVNVLFVVLFAVIFGWLIIYIPLANRQETLNEVTELNWDLQTERELRTQQLVGYGINPERIDFAQRIDEADNLNIDFHVYSLELTEVIARYNGQIQLVRYDALRTEFFITVRMNNVFDFESLNWDFEELGFVVSSSHTNPLPVDLQTYTSNYTIKIEVNDDVE